MKFAILKAENRTVKLKFQSMSVTVKYLNTVATEHYICSIDFLSREEVIKYAFSHRTTILCLKYLLGWITIRW